MTTMINKLTSGRFILTVICGVVFAYAAVTSLISPEAVGIIITIVFKSYFEKKKETTQ